MIRHHVPFMTIFAHAEPPTCATPECERWVYPGTIYCADCNARRDHLKHEQYLMPGWYDDVDERSS